MLKRACIRARFFVENNALVIVFPEGVGGPRAVGGGIGDFVGILQHICAPVVGEMEGL